MVNTPEMSEFVQRAAKDQVNPPHMSANGTAEEMVNHPKHYNSHPAGIECIDVIEWFPHNIGAAIKYLWRAGLKTEDPTEDIRKAEWYVTRELQRIKQEKPADPDPWRGTVLPKPVGHLYDPPTAEEQHKFRMSMPTTEGHVGHFTMCCHEDCVVARMGD